MSQNRLHRVKGDNLHQISEIAIPPRQETEDLNRVGGPALVLNNHLFIEIDFDFSRDVYSVENAEHEWRIISLDLDTKEQNTVFTTGKIKENTIVVDSEGNKNVLYNGYGGFAVTTDGTRFAAIDLFTQELAIFSQSDTGFIIEKYEYPLERYCARPNSFHPDGNILALTGNISAEPGLFIILFDVRTGEFTVFAKGSTAVFSPDGTRLAYLNEERSSVVVRDLDGHVQWEKELGRLASIQQWIDDHRLLVVKAIAPYRETLGIVNLQTEKLVILDIPSPGEIPGAKCRVLGR